MNKQITITLTDNEYERLERVAQRCKHNTAFDTPLKCVKFIVSDTVSRINLPDFEKNLNAHSEKIDTYIKLKKYMEKPLLEYLSSSWKYIKDKNKRVEE